ncbi:MAG: type IV toxin-antitoxin system AbiEi family antitoxin domain-containing protein [Firmicutes bacterium]|nr:type IV toxin-antitoxin system AbiEi family antitoxin domain-containing protein [Bacillota bacterium]
MRQRIYQRAIDSFHENHGYMTFGQLKKAGVTIGQIHELEEMNVLEKISRGVYWCRDCGWEKPKDYKYIEASKVYPKAVFCLESACYLNGLTEKEPEVLTIATSREDRKIITLPFAFRRFYLQNAGLEGEICQKNTDFGSYRYYGQDRTICDMIRMQDKIQPDYYIEIRDLYRQEQEVRQQVVFYAEALRALRNVESVQK